MTTPQAVDSLERIRKALADPLLITCEWLFRGRSNGFYKPLPEGSPYQYGEFIITVGSDFDDEKPWEEATIEWIAAANPVAIRSLLAREAALREALKACAAVCAGETMDKRGLINALELARAALASTEPTKEGL